MEGKLDPELAGLESSDHIRVARLLTSMDQ